MRERLRVIYGGQAAAIMVFVSAGYTARDCTWHEWRAALARAGAWLNLLNLIPVWMLDGGHAALALSKMERIILLTACLALWLVLGENMFFLVAIGAAYQAFFHAELPARPSRATIIYFIAVLTALGAILRLLPGKGLGTQ